MPVHWEIDIEEEYRKGVKKYKRKERERQMYNNNQAVKELKRTCEVWEETDRENGQEGA